MFTANLFVQLRLRVLLSVLLTGGVLLYAVDAAGAESLRQALQRTLAQNPTINAEREKVQAVGEGRDIASAGFHPNITLNGDIGRTGTATDPFGAGETFSGVNSAGYSVNFNQPVYKGGRTRAAVSAADANILASREGLRNVEQDILLATSTAYVAVVRDQSILRLRRNNVDLLGKQLKATLDRQKAGLVTITDVALARSRQGGARSEVALARANLRANRAEYARLTGREAAVSRYPVLSARLPAGNMRAAIRRASSASPLILAALYNLDAAKYGLDQVKSELMPDVSLGAGFDQRWNRGGTVAKTRTANVKLRVSVPLYQGGGVRARIRQARSTLRQRELEVTAARSRVRADVVSSWEAMTAAKARIKAAREQISAAVAALEGVRNEEAVGQRTVLDVLDAEQERLDAEVTLQQARGDFITARFRLIAAMGWLDATGWGS